QLGREELGGFQVAMPGQRPDRDHVTLVADVGQVAEPADVDEHVGHGEPQLHQRQQRVATRQELRILACVGGEAQRLVRAASTRVGKGGRDQEAFLSAGGAGAPAWAAGAPAWAAGAPAWAAGAPAWAAGAPAWAAGAPAWAARVSAGAPAWPSPTAPWPSRA